ncbi:MULTISPECIES: quinone oxidoreductase family protein [Ferrimicrobium]|jgi:NADPH2:quinone reductase|uniref:Quinone oxidoreductase n=1 Tax=Ferrimicrobium acidiphilum TaxID=121039 RepID=A0ABV3Y4S8_9ACTN|nr:quinone oxidoreductase [Ferrimicrobium sp.]
MKAVVVESHGGPENLLLKDIPDIRPAAGEIKLRMRAAGVNFIDIYHREGVYPQRLPFVLGNEGAGEVIELGEGVTEFSIGDRVAYASVMGSFAEHAVIPSHRAVKLPDDVSFDQAAAAMLQGMTAQFLTESCFPLKEGQVAIVHAAAGGVGSLLTQLASHKHHATVIATTSTPEKAERALRNGATHSVDYDHFEELAHDLGGAEVVYDGVGRATFDHSLASLRPRGMLVLYGAASGQVPPFDLQRLNAAGSVYVTRPSLVHYVATREELLSRATTLFGDIASGLLTIEIAARYPLDAVAQAQEDLASRATTGKLIITI